MRNTILTLAGVLAFATVLGAFFGEPLLAQVRAALIKNVDEKGRTPYQQFSQQFCSTSPVCTVGLPAVPAGKRLVVEHVNVEVIPEPGSIADLTTLTGATSGGFWTFAGEKMATNSVAVNAPVLAYFEAGQAPGVNVLWGVETGSGLVNVALTGYLVDLTL